MADGPASYLTLQRGTQVVDRFGAPVGPVERVLTLSGPFFDGLVVSTRAGKRFVDAPEVRRIESDRVELSITCDDCEAPGLTTYVGVPVARPPRNDIGDADRREAIDALKYADVHGRLTVEELGDRCEAVYTVTTPGELERLLPE